MTRIYSWLVAAVLALSMTSGALAQEPRIEEGLGAVKIGVKDYEKSIAFYEAYVGMKRGTRYNDYEWSLEWPRAGMGSSIIMVLQRTDTRKLSPAMLVVNVPDVRKVAGDLKDAGYAAPLELRELARLGVTLLFVRDPDGNTVELISRSK